MLKKIAVFHNFMDNIGGAEIVTLTLAKELEADIYTTNVDTKKIIKMGFEELLPKIFSLGKIPKQAPFKQQLALWKFRRLNLTNKYDFFIISGDWAMSGATNNHPNLWYVHSPLNELWQFKNYIKKEMVVWWKRPLYELWVFINRKLTFHYSKKVDIWVCNSENTKGRIKKYYRQEADIINPPISTKDYSNLPRQNYWLAVNRLLTNKRIDLQLKAFAKLPEEKLIIVGSYEKGTEQFEDYKNSIEKIKPSNVEIIHWVSDKDLKILYSQCKGFITTARDEDFGMTVVEAMSSGKPVIAPKEGGYIESVIPGKTGILIENIDEDKIVSAIKKINNILNKEPMAYISKTMNQAKKFDTEIFIKKILNKIENGRK